MRRGTPRPVVTWSLVAANVAVFLWGTALAAMRDGPTFLAFLTSGLQGGPAGVVGLLHVLERTGSLSGMDWLHGEWWRLATCCFNHVGLLHIILNMYGLLTVGKYVEAVWGRARYLVIYAFAGLGGSFLGVALQPEVVLAGALCGLLAADAVWLACNGRLLPRALTKPWRRSLIVNFALVTAISLLPFASRVLPIGGLPGISYWCHLGGALVGAAVAIVLQVRQFGPPPLPRLATALLAPMPLLGYLFIEHQRAVNEAWATVEERDFTAGPLQHVRPTMNGAIHVYQKRAEPLLHQLPNRRDAAAAADAADALDKEAAAIASLAAELSAAGPYHTANVQAARRSSLRYSEARIELLRQAARCLREGEKWSAEDQRRLEELEKEAAERRQEWNALLE
jgi:membrane associated rhomboid family serine protease